MSDKKLTCVGEYPIPQDDARAIANNTLFMAQHQQNLRDGFVPVGGISVSASAEEQTSFDKAVAQKIRQLEEGDTME